MTSTDSFDKEFEKYFNKAIGLCLQCEEGKITVELRDASLASIDKKVKSLIATHYREKAKSIMENLEKDLHSGMDVGKAFIHAKELL